MQAGFDVKSIPYNDQKCMHREGAPDLYFDGVWLTSEEGFHPDIHFEPFEKEFDIPARFIEQRDSASRQVEIIGDKYQKFPRFGITVNDSPHPFRIGLLGARNREVYDLVGDDSIAFGGLRVASTKPHVRLRARDKIRAGMVNRSEARIVNVTSVE